MTSKMRRPKSHYARISMLGVRARAKNRKPRIMSEWIMSRCRKVQSGCWEWTKYIHPHGYGFTSIKGRGSIGAHTLSFETFRGAITKGMAVLHRCDNRKCVNPDHLFLGTRRDNNADRDSKGRQAIGLKIHTTKLNAHKVLKIRAQFSTGATKKAIASRFGCSAKNIEAIVNRVTWKYI